MSLSNFPVISWYINNNKK